MPGPQLHPLTTSATVSVSVSAAAPVSQRSRSSREFVAPPLRRQSGGDVAKAALLVLRLHNSLRLPGPPRTNDVKGPVAAPAVEWSDLDVTVTVGGPRDPAARVDDQSNPQRVATTADRLRAAVGAVGAGAVAPESPPRLPAAAPWANLLVASPPCAYVHNPYSFAGPMPVRGPRTPQ
jgi:hypothetical protein